MIHKLSKALVRIFKKHEQPAEPSNVLEPVESTANRIPLNERQFKVHELLEGLSLQKDQFGQWYLAALESLNERGRDYLSQAAHSIREITDKLPTRAGVPMFRSPLPQTRDAVVNLLRIKSDSYESGWEFEIADDYMGLNAKALSDLVGVDCQGLLGADVLGEFDQIIDLPGGRLTLASENLDHSGHRVELEDFMGIPIVTVGVEGQSFRLFFDTGAQVSYLQDDLLERFPSAGILADFYPGFGAFETTTHLIPVSLGAVCHTLRCGRLPDLLGLSLMMADVQGILGNTILESGPVGYFPRRGLLSL